MRRFAIAATLVCLAIGLVQAEEFTGYVLKIDGDKVTFRKTKKGTEDLTLQVSRDVKIAQGKRNPETKKYEPDTTIEGGLSNALFTTGKTAARITVNSNGDRITQILLIKLKKKVD